MSHAMDEALQAVARMQPDEGELEVSIQHGHFDRLAFLLDTKKEFNTKKRRDLQTVESVADRLRIEAQYQTALQGVQSEIEQILQGGVLSVN